MHIMKNADAKQYFTSKEVADLLHVSRTTVFNWIQSGKMASEKFGKTYVIPRESIEMFSGLTETQKQEIQESVDTAIHQYGETIRLLGKE